MALKIKNKSKKQTATKKTAGTDKTKKKKLAKKAITTKSPAEKKTVKIIKKNKAAEIVKKTKAPKAIKEPKVAKGIKVVTQPKEKGETTSTGAKNLIEASKPKTPAGPAYVDVDKGGSRNKVRTILISQPKPESDKSPYLELARKYNVKIDFRQFIQIEGVSARDFRQDKVNLNEHHAVILTSRIAIDHYFRMCNEMRYTVPETTKYFCLSESVAYYLQKYVQYRKRKIFHGHQTIADLVDVIKKHREERFLLPVSDVHREQIVDFLDDLTIQYTKATFYKTVSVDLSDFNGKLDYDVVVFFTPAGIQSLFKNFPNYKQGDMRIGAFGATTAKAARDHGLRIDIAAPTIQSPSMTMALENYIKEINKK